MKKPTCKNCLNIPKKSDLVGMAVILCAVTMLSAFTSGSYRMFTYGGGSTEHAYMAIWPDSMIEYYEIDTREEGLELLGRIPALTRHSGALRSKINAEIDQVIAYKTANARESRARILAFSYETCFSYPYMSIILKSTATSASSKTELASVNFNVSTGELIDAVDVVGLHVIQLTDQLLMEMIRRNPERYNPSFAGMREGQAFSITDSEIVFWFNEFQLAPGFEGIVPLTLRLDDIKEVTLNYYEFHTRQNFNLKMIPLRVVRYLGYTLSWIPEKDRITLHHNGELVIELTPGVNNYVREKRFTRSLEAAPEIIDGTTYVPISFFDQILSLVAFSIDKQGNITFASYSGTVCNHNGILAKPG